MTEEFPIGPQTVDDGTQGVDLAVVRARFKALARTVPEDVAESPRQVRAALGPNPDVHHGQAPDLNNLAPDDGSEPSQPSQV